MEPSIKNKNIDFNLNLKSENVNKKIILQFQSTRFPTKQFLKKFVFSLVQSWQTPVTAGEKGWALAKHVQQISCFFIDWFHDQCYRLIIYNSSFFPNLFCSLCNNDFKVDQGYIYSAILTINVPGSPFSIFQI